MDKIKEAVDAVITDMIVAVMGVLIEMATGQFGDIDDEVAMLIGAGLGVAMAEVQLRADAVYGERMEERRDLPDRRLQGCP